MRTRAAAGALAIVIYAAVGYAAAATVTGAWTMSVEGGPHGDATMALTLKQDGTKVTGTFDSGHSPEMAVSGELVDDVLKIETSHHGDSRIIFTARLKADGTLAGIISSPMGDMKWTAERVKTKAEKKDRK
jgi:hypothetical protein